jgi:hypothetical protein
MSEQSPQKDPAAEVTPPEEDLSRKIEGAVDREPLDLVKCVRVFGNYYRCNWWARGTAAPSEPEYISGIMTDIVRKSRFLSATMNAGELILREIGPLGAQQKNLVRQA